MNSQKINGYLVVSSSSGRYRGPDRTPWEVVETAYYSGELPAGLKDCFDRMGDERGLWWRTAKELDVAIGLLEFSNARCGGRSSAELVGVFSPYMSDLGVRPWRVNNASLMGVDVVSIGEWSLLRTLAERATPGRHLPTAMLNEFGLLPDEGEASHVVELYRLAASRDEVEPTADPRGHPGVDLVQVFSIDLGGPGRQSREQS